MAKQRADLALVARGLVESRAKAQALIMAGLVYTGTAKVKKAGDLLAADAELSVKGQEHPWCRAAGVKLAHGLAHFGFDPAGLVALDVGASTGGFTDVLLTRGAARVYAGRCGAWAAGVEIALRCAGNGAGKDQCAASFARAGARAGRRAGLRCEFHRFADRAAGGNGIMRAGGVRGGADQAAIRGRPGTCGQRRRGAGHGRARGGFAARISTWWSGLPGWRVLGVTTSPITGPEGNVEFLIGLSWGLNHCK